MLNINSYHHLFISFLQISGDSESESESVDGDPTQAQMDLLGIAASAIPFSPPGADRSGGAVQVTATPVGSVLAFFRDRAQWSSAWSSSVKCWAAGVWSRSAGTEIAADAATSPALSVPSIPATAHASLPAGRRKGSKTAGAKLAGGQQTVRSSQQVSVSTEKADVRGTSKVDKRNSAAAAAATRRSKRSAARKVYSAAALWCERCWDAGKEALWQSPPLYPRPLLTALLYSVVMVLLLNLLLTSAGPQIPTAAEYTQFIHSTTLASANYLDRLGELQGWLRESSASALDRALRAASSRVQTPLQTSPAAGAGRVPSTEATAAEDAEPPLTAYDFAVHSASQFARFSQDSLLDGASSLLLSRHSLAATGGSSAIGGSAPGGGALVPPTHWVKEGDSISFGDFGSYSSGPKTSSVTPTTSSSSTTTANGARSTASSTTTTTAKSRTTAVPSEYVQKTQYVPKPEYVLAANSQLGSPYLYQWTKDGANISNSLYHNQPFFSIKRAELADAGLYRCLRYDVAVSGAPPVLLLETALQISSTYNPTLYYCLQCAAVYIFTFI